MSRAAAKVPALCPDCQSDAEWLGMVQTGGVTWDGEPYYVECDHPNVPTVGQMLREWQALTALADAVTAALRGMEEGYANRQHGQIVADQALRRISDALDAARADLEAVRT